MLDDHMVTMVMYSVVMNDVQCYNEWWWKWQDVLMITITKQELKKIMKDSRLNITANTCYPQNSLTA